MRIPFRVLAAIVAVSMWQHPATVASAAGRPEQVAPNVLWEPAAALRDGDLFYGPWGAASAPDPAAVYTFVREKQHGVNPGVVVRDPRGRVWHVKQAPRSDQGEEGPVEVTLSRLLSAMGFHQPPVYYLPSFVIRDNKGLHNEAGGRFRLDDPAMHTRGHWSWDDKTLRTTRPYKGLLAILLAFGSWDLKDDNNEIYDVTRDGRSSRWYVVRDLGGALGDTGRFFVKRNNVNEFEQERYIDGLRHGFIHFAYNGKRPGLVSHRITADDLQWAVGLLAGLSDKQWHDAFRAGNYGASTSDRFIRKIKSNILQAQQVTGAGSSVAYRKR